MENGQNTKVDNRLSAVGLILLLIPLAIWGLWYAAVTANPDLSQAERVKTYLSWFPGFLQSTDTLSWVVFVSSGISLLFSIFGRRRAGETLKVVGVFAIVAAVLLILLQTFTLL